MDEVLMSSELLTRYQHRSQIRCFVTTKKRNVIIYMFSSSVDHERDTEHHFPFLSDRKSRTFENEN